ncbi:protein of unknown function [Chryseobacterium sp. JV274]|nr:protein of unknown function [Chryseobacterium sp. JV274]
MFPFTYTFEREIIKDKTSDQVIYTTRDILQKKRFKTFFTGRILFLSMKVFSKKDPIGIIYL